jgi:hypothetical protein
MATQSSAFTTTLDILLNACRFAWASLDDTSSTQKLAIGVLLLIFGVVFGVSTWFVAQAWDRILDMIVFAFKAAVVYALCYGIGEICFMNWDKLQRVWTTIGQVPVAMRMAKRWIYQWIGNTSDVDAFDGDLPKHQ